MLPICFYAIRLLRFMAVHGHCRNKKTTMYKLKSDSYTLVASLIDWSQNIILTEWNLQMQNFTVMCIWLHISLFTGFFCRRFIGESQRSTIQWLFSGWLCDCRPPPGLTVHFWITFALFSSASTQVHPHTLTTSVRHLRRFAPPPYWNPEYAIATILPSIIITVCLLLRSTAPFRRKLYTLDISEPRVWNAPSL